MNRSTSLEALILATKPTGEDNRLAMVLSPKKGVFSAMVYGGRKGKLRSSVSPYHQGRMWLYTDEAKQSVKVTDFDPVNWRSGIRNNLYKTCAAALCAELILKTQGAADWPDLWILVNGFLDGLNLSTEEEARLGTLRFLWRYIALMGLQNESFFCTRCGSNAISQYSPVERGFICPDCTQETKSQNSKTDLPLCPESIEYLKALNTKTPKEVRSIELRAQSVQELHKLLFFLIGTFAETRLKTLEAGKGIL